jgi:hypothetical protein
VTHDGADAQRGDGRELYTVESRRCSQQMPVDFNQAALIDDRRLDEPVTIPLL